jgi:hypothetical protein
VLNAIKAARKSGTGDPIAYVAAAIRAAAGTRTSTTGKSDPTEQGLRDLYHEQFGDDRVAKAA